MTESEILERLRKIIGQVVGNNQIVITNETTAQNVPRWDSFNHINIVMGAEMEFGIRFSTAEREGLKNVGGFVALIEKHLNKKK